MKRPIQQYFDENDRSKGGVSFPPFNEWSVKQKQVSYALSQFLPCEVVHHNIYIAYHYGECPEVIVFAKFFNDYWRACGTYINDPSNYDVIDEKFIQWVEIMQFKEHYYQIEQNFDKDFTRFMFRA